MNDSDTVVSDILNDSVLVSIDRQQFVFRRHRLYFLLDKFVRWVGWGNVANTFVCFLGRQNVVEVLVVEQCARLCRPI